MVKKFNNISSLFNRINQVSFLARKLTLTDKDMNLDEKITTLENSLTENEYFETLNENEKREKQQKVIGLLEKLKLNHIIKDGEQTKYRFIVKAYEAEEEIGKKLEEYKKDANCFNRISEKYNLSPTNKMLEVLELSKLNKNQIRPYLYWIQGNETEEFRELFSIIFYGQEKQRSFDKILETLKNNLEHAPLYLLPDIYLFPLDEE